jgi:hypothetical protein
LATDLPAPIAGFDAALDRAGGDPVSLGGRTGFIANGDQSAVVGSPVDRNGIDAAAAAFSTVGG